MRNFSAYGITRNRIAVQKQPCGKLSARAESPCLLSRITSLNGTYFLGAIPMPIIKYAPRLRQG
jgi:hypothetical protein